MTLDELLLLLPRATTGALPIVQPSPGFNYVTTSLDRFVGPDVAMATEKDSPAVVVISAPGAVGKSTLAAELAFRCRVPLWDLAQTGPVGATTLMGQLTSSFGIPGVVDAWNALVAGNYCIVIDALDEARLKVNESAFEAFLSDIANHAASFSKTNGIRFILLGRTQVADTAWLLLDEKQVSTNLYVIEYFDRPKAERYIDAQIRSMGETAASMRANHPIPFERVRNRVFEALGRAVSRDSEVAAVASGFLGYAPVLDAIAVLLGRDTTNYLQLEQDLSTEQLGTPSSQSKSHIHLLLSVVRSIIERERDQKVLRNLKPILHPVAAGARWDKWEVLYREDEQIARIVGLLVNEQASFSLPCPDAVRSEYEKHVNSWVLDHPFVKDGKQCTSVVFESYAFARVLIDNVYGLRASVENFLWGTRYRPSYLLAEFYLALGIGEAGYSVPPEHVGILYDSFASAESPNLHVRFSIDGGDTFEQGDNRTPSYAEGEFELVVDSNTEEPLFSRVSFHTRLAKNSEIRFSRFLRNASIVLPCHVQLGHAGTDFEIGPSVDLRTRSLKIAAETLVVGGKTRDRSTGPTDRSVLLETQMLDSAVNARPVCNVPLFVHWPNARRFPWTDFAVDLGGEGIGSDARRHAYRRFRRIIMTLRSHSKGSLARIRHKIENQRILQGPIGQRLLDGLVRDRILLLMDNFYHWNPGPAEKRVGISWMDLRRGATSDRLDSYLDTFVQENPAVGAASMTIGGAQSNELRRERFFAQLADELRNLGIELIDATFGRATGNQPIWTITFQPPNSAVRQMRVPLPLGTEPYSATTARTVAQALQ